MPLAYCVGTIAIGLLFLLTIHYYRLSNPEFNRKYWSTFGNILRPYEKTQLPSAFWLNVGAFVLCLFVEFKLLHMSILNAVMLFVSICDPLASLTGQFLHREQRMTRSISKAISQRTIVSKWFFHKFTNGKTVFGSLTFFITAVALSELCRSVDDFNKHAEWSFLHSIILSLIAALSELFGSSITFSLALDDNFCLPFFTALAVVMIQHLNLMPFAITKNRT